MKNSIYRITIERMDLPEGENEEPVVFEGFEASWAANAGIRKTYEPSGPYINLSHNGQFTFLLKGWKGCRSYESFQPETWSQYPKEKV